MTDITKYRYTRDDKYLGRAMAGLGSALTLNSIPSYIKEGWSREQYRGEGKTERDHPLRHGDRCDE